MFQKLALNVNKELRVKAERHNNSLDTRLPLFMKNKINRPSLRKLAKNEEKTEMFLNKIWRQFGNFSEEQVGTGPSH